MPVKKTVSLLLALGMIFFALSQQPSFNFHQLSTSNGLGDPTIRCIAQDKFGYIWVGTLNGLNRFNGYDVTLFQHEAGNRYSLQDNFVPALMADENGDMLVALANGIYRYEHISGRFVLVPGSNSIGTYKMLRCGKTEILMATGQGLVTLNTADNSFTWLKDNADKQSANLLSRYVNDFCTGKNGIIYITTDTGVIQYNGGKHHAKLVNLAPVKNMYAGKIALDSSSNIWISYGNYGLQLLKTNEAFDKYSICDQFTLENTKLTDNRINSIFTDNRGRVWLATSQFGVCMYDTIADKFIASKHDPLQTGSISDNLLTCIFQDKQGYIWLGTEVSGVNYFHPDQTFFHTLQPSYNRSPTLPDFWCRTASEDKEGNLWLGTAHGLAKYDVKKDSYTIFKNTTDKSNLLYFNSIRSVLCDEDVVWIGTGDGLNRYHTNTGKMDFIGEKENMPVSFYWAIAKDHENNIWFGTRDGLYRYNKLTDSFENFDKDSVLSLYAHYNVTALYEDSRHRLWMGHYKRGVTMYDVPNHKVVNWYKDDTKTNSISDNHVSSITEDKAGVIWVATLEGLNSFDEKTGGFRHYLRGKGIVSEKTSSLLTDDRNRLWLAGNRGLYMLDSSRQFFTSFGISDQ